MERSFEVFDFQISLTVHVALRIRLGIQYLPTRFRRLLQFSDYIFVRLVQITRAGLLHRLRILLVFDSPLSQDILRRVRLELCHCVEQLDDALGRNAHELSFVLFLLLLREHSALQPLTLLLCPFHALCFLSLPLLLGNTLRFLVFSKDWCLRRFLVLLEPLSLQDRCKGSLERAGFRLLSLPRGLHVV